MFNKLSKLSIAFHVNGFNAIDSRSKLLDIDFHVGGGGDGDMLYEATLNVVDSDLNGFLRFNHDA